MSTTSIDWQKVRQALKVSRTQLFDRFTKDPSDIHLAAEIRILDDEMLDCTEHLTRALDNHE